LYFVSNKFSLGEQIKKISQTAKFWPIFDMVPIYYAYLVLSVSVFLEVNLYDVFDSFIKIKRTKSQVSSMLYFGSLI